MLASMNTNLDVYIIPNEQTFDIIAQKYEPNDKAAYIERIKKRIFYAEYLGELVPLYEMQMHQFMYVFGQYMSFCTNEVPFVHNKVFFELENMCPAYKETPVLPPQTTYVLSPKTHITIDTGYPDTTAVRVKYEDFDEDVFAYWGNNDLEADIHLDEQIVDGIEDHILRGGRGVIHLLNNTDKQQTCSISYARFVK
jgi:hypothetical protein